ncbi:uncharacterized protein N7446_006363 [Penicillium canescens]|uniref:Uncharacterized protein n=1 Tax=Penicillium canescens TaxID=5083 RepID=A0AAD6IK41_PENCN|nr:uncharacterized protein N7446_006363 [Penicillium canescens]KAJ6051728.1 hypothetical protein N7460_002262 [Penicillium canescens]KAJ6062243.1 hypothetical protein N7446_006363 [Penicillium canescens]KAJ6065491.1 hypothetical protein N7444_001144 [Penicillium canescens]
MGKDTGRHRRGCCLAIGYGVDRVKQAIVSQLDQVEYCYLEFLPNAPAIQLADLLVESTGGKLSRACILGSGDILPLPSLHSLREV